jgi:hypothetical protein
MNNSDEGLGLSVAVYAFALLCGLGLVVLPVYWANSARVYENPGVAAVPNGPAYASRHSEFPLAKLQSKPIVSAAMLAEFNAKAKKDDKPVRRASRPAHRSYAQAQVQAQSQAEPAERRHYRPFFFSLFGG